MKTMKFLLAIFLSTSSLMANNIYDSIELLPFDPAGYFATEHSLDRIFKDQEIKVVIELGSWAGASTRFLGYRVGEGGTVYAIDHWRGTTEHPGEMSDTRLPYIYQLFLSNIRQAGLQDRVVPLRMSTDEALKALAHVQADLIYIDASRNGDRIYKDIMNWYFHLKEDGIMCGAEWREPAVQNGVLRAAKALGKSVLCDKKGYFWALSKNG